MSDPLSFASSIVGSLSLGVQVTDSLKTFYSVNRSKDPNLAKLVLEFADIRDVLRSFQESVEVQDTSSLFGAYTEELYREGIDNITPRWQTLIEELHLECQQIDLDSITESKDRIQLSGNSVAYAFRESTLEKIENMVGELRELILSVLDVLQVKNDSRMEAQLSNFKSFLERTNSSQVSSVIRTWLMAPDASIDHNAVYAKHQPQTGLWFTGGNHFAKWLVQRNSFLWLNGFPGSGKSVLCSTAIQHTFLRRKDRDRVGFSFFYFNFNDKSKQDDHSMLRALLLQLSGQIQDGEQVLEQLYKSHNPGNPTVEALLNSLFNLLSQFRDSYILLDGLDESPRDDKRKGVLRAIQVIRQWYLPSVHLLVTCRDELDIRRSLDPSPDQDLSIAHSDMNRDIEVFVSHQLENNPKSQWFKERHGEIQTKLTANARGMFIHAKLQLREISRAMTRNQLDKCLYSLPCGLDETYARILCGIDEKDVQDVRKVLSLLCFAAGHLTSNELIDAFLGPDQLSQLDNEGRSSYLDDIVEMCGGLVVVSMTEDDDGHPRSVVHMAHFSVQDYLQSDRILQGETARFAIPKNDAMMSEIVYEASHKIVTSTPSHIHLKDPEKDSGYASASRPTTMTVSSEAVLQDETDSHAVVNTDESKHSYNEDIESLASDNDDIDSQASDETTNEGMTGKALIRMFLTEEPNFRLLCEKAMADMDTQRFVENMRRLLKSFHKNLSAEADAEVEKTVARLLRSRRGRNRMSQQIATHIQEEREDIPESNRADLQIPLENKNRIERWLGHEYTELDDQAPDSDSDDDIEIDEFPHISELKAFLRKAVSFQVLLKEFMLLFFPTELRNVLLSIPKEDIWVSQEQDLSLTNRFKTWVEGKTHVRWNWWPLESGKRMLLNGESRIFWYCTCGARQWEEISIEQSELVRKILAMSEDKPRPPHWCRTKRVGSLRKAWVEGKFRKALLEPCAATLSTAAERYTPTRIFTSASTPRHGSRPRGDGQSSATTPNQSHQGSTIAIRGAQIVALAPASQTKSWILVGIQGARRTLIPAQISINDQSTDYSVFRDLNMCYRTHRGRLRLWFSIWRLEYCEVVKFNRLTLERMVREHKDLPTHVDYQYSPRAGAPNARNPPISRHAFKTLFYTCHFPCTWPIPHDCMPPLAGASHLGRIPKRTKGFQSDQTSPVWGLETVFAVSSTYVFVYHCIIVAGPFAFFWFWLKAHPDDLQNASTPLAIVIGALSLFWSSAGILTSRIED